MNAKVEFKLIRNLYFIVHKNYEKTSYVDSSNLVNGKFLDNDLNSLLEITSAIKAKITLTRFIKLAYRVIFPSISNSKSISSKKVRNISAISNIYEQVMLILENNIFENLSFVMAILVFNHYYYKKFNRFVVFFEYHKENLLEFCTNKNRFIGVINSVIDSNSDYYTISPHLSINEIKAIVSSIPVINFSILKISKIYIHGSFAKGSNNNYSDVDLLIETSLRGDYKDVHALYRMLFEKYLGFKIDITLTACKKESLDGFLKNAYESAILLWYESPKNFEVQIRKNDM